MRDQKSWTRRNAKQVAARREHIDRYDGQRVPPEDRRMNELLAELVVHVNGEDGRR